jgi:DNA-directed RNA polymerase subunit H (RpoH/RPB5)
MLYLNFVYLVMALLKHKYVPKHPKGPRHEKYPVLWRAMISWWTLPTIYCLKKSGARARVG